MKNPKKALRLAVTVLLVAFLGYVFSFAYFFDVVGGPVRNMEVWLGPMTRAPMNILNYGGQNYYTNSDVTLYKVYKPLCQTWLLLNGVK